MAIYFIEYDLRRKRDYKALTEELARFGAVRVLESLWCFQRVNASATGLRDHFRNFMDADDGIIVSEVGEWASYNTNGNPNQLR